MGGTRTCDSCNPVLGVDRYLPQSCRCALQPIRPVLKPETWARMYANRERTDAGIAIYDVGDLAALSDHRRTPWPTRR